MRLSRPQARDAPEPIIALIDVVFFLLVFFLLVGRLDATAPFAVIPPQAGIGADMPGGGATLAVAADGALALDGTARDRAALLSVLAARLEGDPDLLVRINADAAAPLGAWLPLAREIEALGASGVVLVVTPGVPGMPRGAGGVRGDAGQGDADQGGSGQADAAEGASGGGSAGENGSARPGSGRTPP